MSAMAAVRQGSRSIWKNDDQAKFRDRPPYDMTMAMRKRPGRRFFGKPPCTRQLKRAIRGEALHGRNIPANAVHLRGMLAFDTGIASGNLGGHTILFE